MALSASRCSVRSPAANKPTVMSAAVAPKKVLMLGESVIVSCQLL